VIHTEEEQQISIVDLDKIPNLKGIFQAFLRGRHISNEDFSLYHELQDREGLYASLFAALGYSLVSDRRGYYFLVPEDSEQTMNATTQKMSLLIYSLVDTLADMGRDPIHVITRGAIDLPEVADVMTARYGELLEEGGMPTADSVVKYFTTVFRRLGFATVNGNTLRFRPPIHRFLDVCRDIGMGPDEGTDVSQAEESLERLRRINFPRAGDEGEGQEEEE